MHKKTLRAGALVAASALSLGVAACGGDDDKDSSADLEHGEGRQGRRDPARLEVVGPLGDRGPQGVPRAGHQGRRLRGRHPERRG